MLRVDRLVPRAGMPPLSLTASPAQAVGVWISAMPDARYLDCVAGLRPALSGSASFNGQSVTSLPPLLRGVCIGGAVSATDTVREHVRSVADIRRQCGGTLRSAPDRLLTDLAIDPHGSMSDPAHAAAAALAAALVSDCPLLILDDPFTALRPVVREHAIEWLRRATQTATVILQASAERDLRAVCPRLVIPDGPR